MLDLKPFFCYVPLDGTFFVLWSAGAETVSRNEAVISWEDCPRSFLFRLLETVYPEIPPGCMRKGVCRFVDKNRTQAGRFSSLLEQKKPFRKAVGLLNRFWLPKQRRKQPQNRRFLFRDLFPPFPEQGRIRSNPPADSPRVSKLCPAFSMTLIPRAGFVEDKIAQLAFLPEYE